MKALLSRLSPRARAWVLVLCGVGFAFAFRPLYAWAQEEVLMTGQDPTGRTLAVRVDSSGNLIANPSTAATAATHGVCVNTTMTIGTSSVACPTTPLATRSSILIQLNQSGQNLRVTSNGAAATSTFGIKVPDGSSYNDNLVGTVSTQCICDAASCELDIVECP